MTDAKAWQGFETEIRKALEALKDASPPGENRPDQPEQAPSLNKLPNLLEQCRKAVERAHRHSRPPIRTIHHLACTGGTLISRCIAAQPNVNLLSEVDPFSPLAHSHPFVPTDLIGLAKFASHPADVETRVSIFLAGIEVIYRTARRNGLRLVLREHSHGLFMVGSEIPDRPDLLSILSAAYPLRSLVTIRHPMDVFASMERNDWIDFSPGSVEEFSRRYLAFLSRYRDLPVMKYEDFVRDPKKQMQRICEILQLEYNDDFPDLFSAIALSGDSGRKGGHISPRPRRNMDEKTMDGFRSSESYIELCHTLGYSPDL